MDGVLAALQDALHAVSQAVLYPVIVLLLLFVCYALFSVGSVLVEFFRERRHFDVALPRFLRSIKETPMADIPAMLDGSGLLREQRQVLLTVFENRDFDEEALWALAKRLLLQERERRQKTASRDDAIAKLAPMVGLMGTLIPLGPGIVAFGRGDGTVMAGAMLVAFDTTVAGLIVAAVMFIIARVRRGWYASYQASLEAGATTLLERIGKERDRAHVQPSPSAAGGAGGFAPPQTTTAQAPASVPAQASAWMPAVVAPASAVVQVPASATTPSSAPAAAAGTAAWQAGSEGGAR